MKGQFIKPICAIMTSLVMILGTFALVLPYQEAEANHDQLRLQVLIIRGGLPPLISYVEIIETGDTSYGTVEIDLNTRDLKRILRWCGTDTFPLTINQGGLFDSTFCSAPGPWSAIIQINSQTDADANINHNHAGGVTATIKVV